MINQILRPITRYTIQRGPSRTYHKHDFKYVTFDEACAPEGSWKQNYDKQQRKYNRQLIIGVAGAVISLATIIKFDLLFFNYVPPKLEE